VAGLGLIGAMLVPIAVVFDGGLTILGTAFVAIVLASTGVVGIARRWLGLLMCAAAASLPQIAVVVAQADDGSARVVALAGAFALLYAGIGVALQLTREARGLDGFAASFVFGGGVVAGASALVLYDGHAEGLALFAPAVAFALGAAYFFPATRDRDLSILLAALGLSLGAVAVSDLLSGPVLAVAWAAEAGVLAWLADRTRERRFQVVSFAYFALAVGHAFALDAPPSHLFAASSRPAAGIAAVLAAAGAAAIVAVYARTWREERETEGIWAWIEDWLAGLARAQAEIRIAAASAAAVLAMYAASLGVLALFVALGTHRSSSFDWGHVAVSGMDAAVGLVVLVAGLRWRRWPVELGALAWLVAVLAKHLLYDLPQLPDAQRSTASFAVAGVALAVALSYQLLKPGLSELSPTAAAAELVSAGLAVSAAIVLVGGDGIGGAREGAALLGVAAVYGLSAAGVFRQERDLATLLWSTSLAIAAAASIELLSGTWLVLAWAVAAAALAALADRVGEGRFVLAALGFVTLALGQTLVFEAPPGDLFLSSRHPGVGIPALLLVALAVSAAGFFAARVKDRELTLLPRLGTRAPWLTAGLVVYAGSLGILELAEGIGAAGVDKNFQHGHTVVSAFWGILGLTALYGGLRQRSRTLRLGGFGLFGISLAKLFLYDLAALNSITRALSFLAVGALLLLGGFFYQRLSAQFEDRTLP
jgi:uncharacterized membrane protein